MLFCKHSSVFVQLLQGLRGGGLGGGMVGMVSVISDDGSVLTTGHGKQAGGRTFTQSIAFIILEEMIKMQGCKAPWKEGEGRSYS